MDTPKHSRHVTGSSKSQIDWLPLNLGGLRPTQGKPLAVMQVCGGSQSYNAVNQMRVFGRWIRMVAIPNHSSVAKAFLEFSAVNRVSEPPMELPSNAP